jgi:hypothetical protein
MVRFQRRVVRKQRDRSRVGNGSVANRQQKSSSHSMAREWHERLAWLVIVVFELVAYRDDGNSRLVFDFEQRDVARSPKWNDQFS